MQLPARKLILILLLLGMAMPAAFGTGLHVLLPSHVTCSAAGQPDSAEAAPGCCSDCCGVPTSPSDGPTLGAEHDCSLCKFLAQAKHAPATENRAQFGRLLVLRYPHGTSPLLAAGFLLTQAARGPPIC